MTRAQWYVKLEDIAGVEWSGVVDAVGYAQAITFARDKMRRDGIADAYTAWEVVRVERTRTTDRLTHDLDKLYSVLP